MDYFPQKNSRKASFLENLLFSKLTVYSRTKISGQYNKLYQNSYEPTQLTIDIGQLTIENKNMIYLATDHAGFDLKEKAKEFLKKEGYQVEDCGAYEFDKNDDYPDFISKAAEAVSKDHKSLGIIFGHSGQGEAIVANKFPNVRAVVFYGDLDMIPLTREHNNANILSLGVRFLTEGEALEAVRLWLETPFTREERHIRRIEKIKQIEKSL